MDESNYDVVIIGGGPGGTTAAIFAARAKMKAVILDKAKYGGSLSATSKIANYPGYPTAVTGIELLQSMRGQAAGFGAQFVQTQVYSLELNEEIKRAYTADGVFSGKALILATGARARTSHIVGEEELLGRGVSYCATCDGAFYQDEVVAVVGESQEALEEALFLTKFAREVHAITPRDTFKAMPDLLDEAQSNAKITLHFHKQVKEIVSRNDVVSEIVVSGRSGERDRVEVSGVFMYLMGNKPGTEFLQGMVEMDDEGYIITDENMQTNVPGVFAIGDVRRSPLKQVVTATSDGAIAAMAADKFVHRRSALIKQWA